MKKGLMHIYSGNGKGKTTAAIGLGVRAAGRGYNVLLVQFLKGEDSGEIKVLDKLEPGFEIIKSRMPIKFVCDMNAEELQAAGELQKKLLKEALERTRKGEIDVLILDEILGAVENGMIDAADVVELANKRPDEMELVLTGRIVPEELAELSDYHSEIICRKHPMENGISSRIGIEK